MAPAPPPPVLKPAPPPPKPETPKLVPGPPKVKSWPKVDVSLMGGAGAGGIRPVQVRGTIFLHLIFSVKVFGIDLRQFDKY